MNSQVVTPCAPKAGLDGKNTGDIEIFTDNKGNFVQVLIDRTNRRLRVLDYRVHDWEEVINRFYIIATGHRLGKILFYTRPPDDLPLTQSGYVKEGVIPAFFQGVDALCCSYFTDPARAQSSFLEEEEEILNRIRREKSRGETRALPAGYTIRPIDPEQVADLVDLYRDIFISYPSPLLDPDYVYKVMQSHVIFYGAFAGSSLAGAASAEMDLRNRNAEITDCATLREHRGKGLLVNLILALEKQLAARQVGSLYSLARAGSYGMNAALFKLDYAYQGRFINNCHIGGRFEDMNLWTKTI